MDRNNTVQIVIVVVYASLSARRAWIEIFDYIIRLYRRIVSLSARRAWIEISIGVASNFEHPESLSARRAWIEMVPY